jgi:hypothetical protein
MPKTYKIIYDEQELQKFVEWLPELKKHETYYVSLLARRKYCKALSEDKIIVKRFTSEKTRLIDKIRHLEAVYGCYLDGKRNPIPQEALALYISVNPRNLEAAALESAKLLLDKVTKPYTNYIPHKIVLSTIQKTRGTRYFVDIDFDDGEIETEKLIKLISDYLDQSTFNILKTRGGYHILVRVKEAAKKNKMWFKELQKEVDFDMKGDNLIPVPGCCQGSFSPILY